MSAQVNIEAYRTMLHQPHSHALEFNASAQKATDSSQSYSLNYYSSNKRPSQNHFFIVEIQQAVREAQTFTNAGLLHARLSRQTRYPFEWEFFGQDQWNDQGSLNHRALLGSGIRLAQLRYPRMPEVSISLGMGGMIETERYTTQTDTTLIRATNYASFSGMIGDVTLSNVSYFQPALSDLSNYRVLNNFSAMVSLNKWVYLNFFYRIDYRSLRPVGLNRLNYNLGMKFGFKF